MGSGGALWAPPVGSRAEPRPKSNIWTVTQWYWYLNGYDLKKFSLQFDQSSASYYYTDVWRVCCHCVVISQNAKIEPLSRILAYDHAYQKTMKFGAFCAEFSAKTTTVFTDSLHKKWTNNRFMHEKVGSNNIDWPYTRESGGVNWPTWPRVSAVYDCVVFDFLRGNWNWTVKRCLDNTLFSVYKFCLEIIT